MGIFDVSVVDVMVSISQRVKKKIMAVTLNVILSLCVGGGGAYVCLVANDQRPFVLAISICLINCLYVCPQALTMLIFFIYI